MDSKNTFNEEELFEFWEIYKPQHRKMVHFSYSAKEFCEYLRAAGYDLTEIVIPPSLHHTFNCCIIFEKSGIRNFCYLKKQPNGVYTTPGWCLTISKNHIDIKYLIVGENKPSLIHELGHVQLQLLFKTELKNLKDRLFAECIDNDKPNFYNRYCKQGGLLQLYPPPPPFTLEDREYFRSWQFFINILEDFSINTRMQSKGERITNLTNPLEDFIRKCCEENDIYAIGEDDIYFLDKMSCCFALLFLEEYNRPSELKDDIVDKFLVIDTGMKKLNTIVKQLNNAKLNYDLFLDIFNKILEILEGYGYCGKNF